MARGRDLPPQPFRLPFDWHADPLKDRNWMFQLHASRMLDPYLNRLVADPGHPRAFADILEVIADWHRGNARSRAGRFTWYDMSTSLRGLKLDPPGGPLLPEGRTGGLRPRRPLRGSASRPGAGARGYRWSDTNGLVV